MTGLPHGVTRITFDANGVPRIRDTGIPVWHLASQDYDEAAPDHPLQIEDLAEVAAFRIAELQEFMRRLSHDTLSQVNSIFGFAEMALRGMIEPHEEHDLITKTFYGNAQTLLNLLKFSGHVLNGTTDRQYSSEKYRHPVRVHEFVQGLMRLAEQNCQIVFEVDEQAFVGDLLLLSDEALQAALSELIRLAWFARRFDPACHLSVSLTDDSYFCLTSQRRLKQAGSTDFLTDWSLSPVPIAAYILEERGGSLNYAADAENITFNIQLPLIAEP